MNTSHARPPTDEETLETLEHLTDIVVAAQELGEKWREQGRPYLAYCARELEDDCHTMFHQIELLSSGWEPVRNAHR